MNIMVKQLHKEILESKEKTKLAIAAAKETFDNNNAAQEYYKREIQRIYYKQFGNEHFQKKLRINTRKPQIMIAPKVTAAELNNQKVKTLQEEIL